MIKRLSFLGNQVNAPVPSQSMASIFENLRNSVPNYQRTTIRTSTIIRTKYKEEIKTELKKPFEEFQISDQFTLDDLLDNAPKPQEYTFTKTYNNYIVDNDFGVKYLFSDGEIVNIDEVLETNFQEYKKKSFNFGNEIDVEIELNYDHFAHFLQEKNYYDDSSLIQGDEEQLLNTNINDLLQPLYHPFEKKENNPLKQIDENYKKLLNDIAEKEINANKLKRSKRMGLHSSILSEQSNNNNNIEETIVEENVPQTIEFIQTPLQFIQVLENKFYSSSPTSITKEFNLLQNCIDKHNITIDLLTEQVELIAPLIKENTQSEKDSEIIFCLDYEKSFLYLCNNKSLDIKKFCMREAKLIDTFSTKIKGAIVYSMDAFNDWLVCGFSNGMLLILHNNKKGLLEIEDKIFNERNIPILCVKFIKNRTKDTQVEIIVSDFKGEIYCIYFKKALLKTKIEREFILNPFNPDPYVPDGKITDMKVKITEKEQEALMEQICPNNIMPFYIMNIYSQLQNKDFFAMLIGVSFDEIVFYQIKPTFIHLQKYSRPSYITGFKIADISIGTGYIPSQQTIENGLTLFLISWGHVILAFTPKFEGPTCIEIKLCAHYIHSCDIIRFGFLKDNYVFLIDKNFKLTVIATADFNYGDVGEETTPPEQGTIKTSDKLKITEIDISRYDLFAQNLFGDNNNTYYGSIIKYAKSAYEESILFLGRNKVTKWSTTSLDNCLSSVTECRNYEIIYSFCIGIFKYKKPITALLLGDVKNSDEFNERLNQCCIKTVPSIVSDHILKIFMLNEVNKNKTVTGLNENNSTNIPPSSDVNYQIQLVIEFCKELNMMDKLFTTILEEIKTKNLLEVFIDNLEGYIFKGDFFSNNDLNKIIILDIIECYSKTKRFFTLSKLLLHIDHDLLSDLDIQNAIQDKELLNAFIYVNMNTTSSDGRPNYFRPIDMMIAFFSSKNDSPQYSDFINSKNEEFYNEAIISSRQYFGHRLLWYCNYCCKKQIYPHGTLMEDKYYNEIVCQIYLRMVSDPIASMLLEFDSFSYFQIFENFYLDKDLSNIIHTVIQTNSFFIEFKEKIGIFDDLSEITPANMLKSLINKCLVIENNFYVLLDLYTFLYKYYTSSIENKIQLDDQVYIGAMKYYLNLAHEKNTPKGNLDTFKCHSDNFMHNQGEIQSEEKLAIFFLKLITNLPDSEVEYLINISVDNNYLNYQMELFTITLNGRKMFETKQKLFDKETDKSPEWKNKMLFNWILDTLKELYNKRKTSNAYNDLKQIILENLVALSKQNFTEVLQLVREYFEGQINDIINALNKDPPLQFEVLKRLLHLNENPNDLSAMDKLIQGNDAVRKYDKNDNSEIEKDKVYLQLIKLSCELGEKDSLLNILKSRPSLCTNEVYEILNKNNVYDCAIYVCGFLGRNEQGIDLVQEIVYQLYEKITKNIKSDNFHEKKHNFYMNKFKLYISLGIGLCLELAEHRNVNEEWLILLTCLYELRTKFQKFKDDCFQYERVYEFSIVEKTILDLITEILEHMSTHIGVIPIIEIVSDRFHNAGFREFRKLVLDVLYVFQKSISYLKKTLVVFQNTVKFSTKELVDVLSKGTEIKIGFRSNEVFCSSCNAELGMAFKTEEYNFNNLIAFQCGHVYHVDCAASENREKVCLICRQNEHDEFPATLPPLNVNKINIGEITNNTGADILNTQDQKEKKEKYLKEAKGKIDALKKFRQKTNMSYAVFDNIEKTKEKYFQQNIDE